MMERTTESMDDLPQRLAARLEGELPEASVRRRYSPAMNYGRYFAPAPYDARAAAVVIVLYPHHGQWYLPLTVRATTVAAHAGQISLPGGVIEQDETGQQAALRELEEELGVSTENVRILGRLSPLYLYASNFVVEPWVAVASERPTFVPDAREVAELLEVPIAHLLDAANVGTHEFQRGALRFTVPHFDFQGHYVWGATCMILGELVAVLDELKAQPAS